MRNQNPNRFKIDWDAARDRLHARDAAEAARQAAMTPEEKAAEKAALRQRQRDYRAQSIVRGVSLHSRRSV